MTGRYDRDDDRGGRSYGMDQRGREGRDYDYASPSGGARWRGYDGGRDEEEYGYAGDAGRGRGSYYGGSMGGSHRQGYDEERRSFGYGRIEAGDDPYNRANYNRAHEDYAAGGRDYDRGSGVGTFSDNYYGGRYGRGYNRYGRGFADDRSRRRYGESRYDERGWFDRATDEVASWFGDQDAERRRRIDEIRARHRGRGPKGYRRSDDRIKEDINDRLSDDPYVDASDIEVSVNDREVTLTGTVDSRLAKRRAEDIAESVTGVTNVENRLRLNRNIMTNATTGPTTSTEMTERAAKAASS